ncbi:hypothetical protein [Luteibacter yeojuensis]|uniref:Uncharacterized protein n=1 Tax=Luteibacter yeojuensis TaxID=345309 RepID=A0A7X5QU32_9GAMM|nr:hypothetical protein [Luteibacter yeojuensis]NID15431.1 hypothetical protein [Luteibacter yeojuensis]
MSTKETMTLKQLRDQIQAFATQKPRDTESTNYYVEMNVLLLDDWWKSIDAHLASQPAEQPRGLRNYILKALGGYLERHWPDSPVNYDDMADYITQALPADQPKPEQAKCVVCDEPNTYDPESGVCLRCQGIEERKPEQVVGDGVVVGYIREQDVAHLKGGNRNDWRWSYIASAPNESHTLPVYTAPRPAVATPAEVTEESEICVKDLKVLPAYTVSWNYEELRPTSAPAADSAVGATVVIRWEDYDAALTAQCQVRKDGQGVASCDWPAGNSFTVLDDPDEHKPCYLVMPDGAALPLCHHATNGVDQARAKFIADACNAALASPSAGAVVPEDLARDATRYRKLCNSQMGVPGVACIALPSGPRSGDYVTAEDADAAVDGLPLPDPRDAIESKLRDALIPFEIAHNVAGPETEYARGYGDACGDIVAAMRPLLAAAPEVQS